MKKRASNFPKNEYFLPPDTHKYVCVSGGEKYSFFGKFGVLCFLITSLLRFAFCLITGEMKDYIKNGKEDDIKDTLKIKLYM